MLLKKKRKKKLVFSVITTQKFFAFIKNKASNTRLSLSRFDFQINQQIKSIANAEVTLFNQSNFPIKFKPNHAIQGALVFALTLLLAVTLTTTTTPRQKIQTASTINSQSITTKQTSPAIAGSRPGWMVKWTKLISKSDITSTNNKVLLPKSAKNIKVQTVTKTQADQIISYHLQPQLTMEDRKTLAYKATPWLAALNFAKYFYADLKQAATDIVEKVKNKDKTQTESKVKTKKTDEAVIVELPTEPDTSILVASEDIAVANTPGSDPGEPSSSDYVAVSYETPAPTITEQETATGKTVTVSSNNTETIDCESLNPEKSANASNMSEAFSNAGASLLNSLRQAVAFAEGWFKTLTRFLFADLEQAVSELLNDSGDNNVEQEQTLQNDSGDSPSPQATAEQSNSSRTVLEESEAEEAEAEQAYQDCLAQQAHLTDVLASTTIPEIYKVGQEDKIKIKWKNNNNQDVEFHAYDLDNNGKLDYVEWTVPHLSDQIFEIIFISKAWHLDSNLEILEDIYDQVATQEGTYQENTFATVPQDNFVRVTFQQVLDNTKDITIYARPSGSMPGIYPTIEVYPVYEDQDGNETQGQKLDLVNDGQNPDFSNIDHEGKYRVLLTNLATPTDKFDLKIIGVGHLGN